MNRCDRHMQRIRLRVRREPGRAAQQRGETLRLLADREQGEGFNRCQTLSSQFRIPTGCFADHDFGDEDVVCRSSVRPPFAREFLIPQDHNVSTQTPNEIC